MKADFPVYMASDELLSATGKIASTPLTLILDAQGRIVSHVKGYVNFEKWHQLIQKNSPETIECSENVS
jgi:thioredoxin-related protein